MRIFLMFVFLVLYATTGYASFSAVNDTTSIGFFNKIWCSTGVTCTKSGSQMKITANLSTGSGPFTLESDETMDNSVDDTIEFKSNDSATTLRVEGFEASAAILELVADDGDEGADKFYMQVNASDVFSIGNNAAELATLSTAGDWVFKGTTPTLTVGDAGAEDTAVIYDGNAQDFYVGLDDSADKLLVGLGATVGNTPRMSFNSADLNIVLGDASAADVGFIYDGNAVDFNISLDDSADKLVIGLGSAAGTTNRMAFNSADLNIVLGDASAADMAFVWDGNAEDYYMGIDDSADELLIGYGATVGTTPAMSIDSSQVVTFSQNPVFAGTTPAITIGDGGAEDTSLAFDGNAVDFALGLDDSADKLVIGLGTTLGTTERMTFNSGDLNIILGDATAADVGFIYDGNAQDFNISLDDSADKLVIGLGSVAGTTNRMAFNSADLNIVLGDASEADVGFVYDGNAQDYNISLDDSTDDLVIGLGSAAGTTDALRIDENQDVTVVQDLLPLSTITGDGGAALVGMLQNQVASTTTTATIAQCGTTFVSDSADTITLPEASTALGCRYTFVCGTADDFAIDVNDGTDAFGPINSVASGSASDIAPSAGDSITCTDIGSSITVEAVGANLWVAVGVANGAWTDTN